MKDSNNTKYYKLVPSILNELNKQDSIYGLISNKDSCILKLTNEQTNLIVEDFKRVCDVFDRFTPKDRTNIFNTVYVLDKLCGAPQKPWNRIRFSSSEY